MCVFWVAEAQFSWNGVGNLVADKKHKMEEVRFLTSCFVQCNTGRDVVVLTIITVNRICVLQL